MEPQCLTSLSVCALLSSGYRMRFPLGIQGIGFAGEDMPVDLYWARGAIHGSGEGAAVKAEESYVEDSVRN
jgi:hypothetical protein